MLHIAIKPSIESSDEKLFGFLTYPTKEDDTIIIGALASMFYILET